MVNLPSTVEQTAASLFQQFADDEKALLTAAGRFTSGRIADFGKPLEELKAESLVKIQFERVRKEAQQRTAAQLGAAVLEGTQAALAEHARVQPAPAKTTAAPVVAPSASDAPAIDPLPMAKGALIASHEHEWPTIKRDISDAATNGLAAAAKAGSRGWLETRAIDWHAPKAS